jgi:hypothetical protein
MGEMESAGGYGGLEQDHILPVGMRVTKSIVSFVFSYFKVIAHHLRVGGERN